MNSAITEVSLLQSATVRYMVGPLDDVAAWFALATSCSTAGKAQVMVGSVVGELIAYRPVIVISRSSTNVAYERCTTRLRMRL